MKISSSLITERIEYIFLPGKVVDILINNNSNYPMVRSSIIIDCNYRDKIIKTYQPSLKIAPNFKHQNVSLTTLIKKRLNEKTRIGLSCKLIDFISDYTLINGTKAEAIVLEYEPPMKQSDIRSSYRIVPNLRYLVNAKLILEKYEYESGVDFSIYNISATGIGLIMSSQTTYDKKSLLNLSDKDTLDIILFLDDSQRNSMVTILTKLNIVSIDKDNEQKNGFIRAKYSGLDIIDDEILNNFINEAQLYEIEKMAVK